MCLTYLIFSHNLLYLTLFWNQELAVT